MYAQVDSSVPGDLPILCVGFNHLRRADILFFFKKIQVPVKQSREIFEKHRGPLYVK